MADVPGTYLRLNPLATGSIHEIDSSIAQLQHSLSMFHRSHPRRPISLLSLGKMRFHRYTLSDQREDLDKAIAHFTESILLPPLSLRPLMYKAKKSNFDVLYFLSVALLRRSCEYKQPEDSICAAKYLVHLRDQHHGLLVIPPHKFTTSLVCALAMQVRLKAGNVMQNVREIAILSRELLTLQMSNVDPARLISLLLLVSFELRLSDVPDQPLDELIECLRAAREHRPDLLEGRIALAHLLVCRYFMTCTNDDYEEATSILDDCPSPGNTQDEYLFATGLKELAVLARLRSLSYQSPEHLEEAIYRSHACFNSSSFKLHYSPVRFESVLGPEVTAMKRFRYFGSIERVETLSSDSSSLENSGTIDKLKKLLQWICNNDAADTTKIDETVEKGRSILASSSDAGALDSFGKILREESRRTRKIEGLNESISIFRQLIETPLSPPGSFRAYISLSQSLLDRFRVFPGYCTQDLDEAMGILSQRFSSAYVILPDRFRLACQWAYIARFHRHSSVATAYDAALSLMQDTPLFSPTLELQHSTLATHVITQSLPLDFASYLVDEHQLKQAIETLERGRALLWSEMRHFRAPVDQLLKADADLGHRFAAVNRDLEELTKSVPPSHKLSIDDTAADGLCAVDPFGRLVMKQCGLWKERAKLISQIQALPGFDGFLASPPFDTLRSAASSGPVIIINHSTWRSDILILLSDMPPTLIPTPRDFYKRTTALKDKLLGSRPNSELDADWSHYDEVLASVLKELYELVGKPVIDRLHQLQVPEQSRIWWCPTSVFCSLPLHAMGPIPSDDGEPRYFLDLYICSYTPTLSALIQSRNRDLNSRSLDRPSILLVAQPDPNLPDVGGEIQVVQALETKVTSLISDAATPATVIDGFHHHGFVHFACHGTLKAGKPFEAGFELHGDERLTLLEIVRSHIPTAEFAFLSACHTAEATEGSVMDEGLHLAAAVQYCGFRSVVGTMWAMADEDGRDLAKNFYKALLSNSRREQPYNERSAKALQFAVKRLRRKKRITLERWVNFVHYGA